MKKSIWNESKEVIESAIEEDDIKSIKIANIKLIQKLKKLGITNLKLTSLGNSIALGKSKEDITKPLFDRNDSLDEVADYYDFNVKKYTLARDSIYNNIYNWLIENESINDINLLNSMPLADVNLNVKDLTENADEHTANIIIYNGCSLRKKHTIESLKKDISILRAFLANVQHSNRVFKFNTEVYVSGIPNIKIFNNEIKKTTDMFSCSTYVKPVDCDMFNNGELNFKYNEQQYRRYNKEIIKSIDANYLFKQALIDIDRNNGKEDVINNWLTILQQNHCNLKTFKQMLNDYNKSNKKRLVKNK